MAVHPVCCCLPARVLLLSLLILSGVSCIHAQGPEEEGSLFGRVEVFEEELRRGVQGSSTVTKKEENHQTDAPAGGLSKKATPSRALSPDKGGTRWPGLTPWRPWQLPSHLVRRFRTAESRALDPSRFHLRIVALGFSRVASLKRLLTSLTKVDYMGDRVSLDIVLDHPHNPTSNRWGRTKAQQMASSRVTLLQMIDDIPWQHGPKTVHSRVSKVGMQAQWLEAWWPESVNEFAFIAEDDLQVSTYIYSYFKRMVWFYYYNQTNFSPQVYGVSMMHQWMIVGKWPGHAFPRAIVPEQAYLYQQLGTWGPFFFPIHWKEFRVWYEAHRFVDGEVPALENHMSWTWWQDKGNQIWTPWFIRWVHGLHFYSLYPWFPNFGCLSRSYREAGVDFNVTKGPDHPLLFSVNFTREGVQIPHHSMVALNTSVDARLPSWWTYLPDMASMKKFDWCFRPVPSREAPVLTFDALLSALSEFNATQVVAVIPLTPALASYALARNWLCFMQGLNVHNYIFLLELLPVDSYPRCKQEVAETNTRIQSTARSLARRGHLTMLLQPSTESAYGSCDSLFSALEGSTWTLPQATFVQSLLEKQKSVFVHPPGALWRRDPFKCLEKLEEPSFWGGGEGWSSFAFWVKGSEQGKKSFTNLLKLWQNAHSKDWQGLGRDAISHMLSKAGVKRGQEGLSTSSTCVGTATEALRSDPFATPVILRPLSKTHLESDKLWQLNEDLSCAFLNCTTEVFTGDMEHVWEWLSP